MSAGFKCRQGGVVLVIALIMLLIVTILGVTGVSVLRTDLKVIENIESKEQLRNLVDSAVQESVARGLLTAADPSGFGAETDESKCPFSGGLSEVDGVVMDPVDYRCFDVTGDGKGDDVAVFYTDISCVTAVPKKNNELNLSDPNQLSCFYPGAYSLCSDAVWEIGIVALDRLNGAVLEMRQAVTVLSPTTEISSQCK